ncbi:helix-turn-helix domain-containing protein [Xanthobacter flavus]|uniref:XRE family transcriptional regulator n=1 Tax=Xanthobacter flavus TaxID=281 RepID=UPI00372B2260
MSRTPKATELPNRIQELRLASGMSLEDVAEAVGSTSSTVSKLERGRLRLTSDWMFRLAPALGVAPSDLLPQAHQEVAAERSISLDVPALMPKATIEPADVEIPATSRFSRDLPVLGTAGGAVIRQVDGFRMEHEVVDYVRRPPALAKQLNAYAIFVVGESMAPMHNPGDLRFVDPEQRPSIGDSVIVQTKHFDTDPGQGYIKILKRRTPTYIVLQQLNPAATLEIPAQYVVSVHKVLTMNDLFGV